MINQKESYFEDNVTQLISAGLGGAARQDMQTKERTLQHLIARLREQKVATEFPDTILIFAVGILILMGIWIVAQIFGSGIPEIMSPFLIISAFILLGNLAFVPVATIIIIWRKRYA